AALAHGRRAAAARAGRRRGHVGRHPPGARAGRGRPDVAGPVLGADRLRGRRRDATGQLARAGRRRRPGHRGTGARPPAAAGAPVSGADAVSGCIGPRSVAVGWMRPLCRLAFEASYHVDVTELTPERLDALTAAHPTLLVTGDARREDYLSPLAVARIGAFL